MFNHNKMKIMLREYSLKADSVFVFFHCIPSRYYFPFITAKYILEQGKKHVEA